MPNADWMTVKMMITDHGEFDRPTCLRHGEQRVDQRLLRQHRRQQEQRDHPEPALDPADADRVRVQQRQQRAEDRDDAVEMKIELHSFCGKLTRSQNVFRPVEVELVRPAQRTVLRVVRRAT